MEKIKKGDGTMEEELQSKIIRITTENVFEILRKNGFEITEKKNTYLRTEQLLYLLPKLKSAINHNKSRINELKEYLTKGIEIKSSNGIHVVSNSISISSTKESSADLIEKEINLLNQRNYIINTQIKWLNGILINFKSDKYYKVLELKYFENKTLEEMAEFLECDISTITRNKNRLINELKVLLFPNDYLNELGA